MLHEKPHREKCHDGIDSPWLVDGSSTNNGKINTRPETEDSSLDLLTDSAVRIYSKIDQNVNSLPGRDDTQNKARNLERMVADMQK